MFSNNQGKMPTKAMLTMRLVIGAYLIYLAAQLGSGIYKGTSENPVVMGIFTVIFAVGGLGIILISVKAMMQGDFDHGNDPSEEESVDVPYEEIPEASADNTPVEESQPEETPEQ